MCGEPSSTGSSRPFINLQAATWVEPDCYEMRPDARRFESWDRNVTGQLGLGAAVDYALGWGLADIAGRIEPLAAELGRRLAEIRGVRDCGRPPCGINCHTSSDSTLLDAGTRRLPDLVRASVHYYNTEEEVARFAAAVAALA
jgi:cysteine desulfurase/selenocysteine lyase